MEDGPCVDGSPIRNGGFSDLCWRLVGGHISTSTFAYDPDFNLQEQRSQENVPSGKHTRNYGKSPFYSWGKSTISMAIFNSYVCLPEGNGQ